MPENEQLNQSGRETIPSGSDVSQSGVASLDAVTYDLNGEANTEESSCLIIPFQNVIPLFPDVVDDIFLNLIVINFYGGNLNETNLIQEQIKESIVPSLRTNYINRYNVVVNSEIDITELDRESAIRILYSQRALAQHVSYYMQNCSTLSVDILGVLERLPATSAYVDELQFLVHHTNPSFNAFNRAEELYQAMFGGVFGFMQTDEEAVYTNLANLDPLSSLTLKKAYAAFCAEVKGETRNLESDLDDEMDGAEQDRYELLLEGDESKIIAASLRDAMEQNFAFIDWGTDESAIMSLLRNKTPEEIRQISIAYENEYHEPLLSRLTDELDEDSHDLERMTALMDSDTNEADAHALDDAMHGGLFGWGTDEDAIEEVYRIRRQEIESNSDNDNLSYSELQEVISQSNNELEASYNSEYTIDGENDSSLRNAFEDETTDHSGYRELFNALADNDQDGVDASQLMLALHYSENTDEEGNTTVTVTGNGNRVNDILDNSYQRAYDQVYRDHRGQLNSELNGVTDRFQRQEITRRYRIQMERLAFSVANDNFDAVTSSFNANDEDATLTEQVDLWTATDDRRRAQDLISNGGFLTPAERIHYAISGSGTDVEMIRETLQGRSREEIQRIDESFRDLNDGNSMSYMLFEDSNWLGITETEGRDEADLKLMIEHGVARNREEELTIAEERYDNEVEMGGLNWADTEAMEFHIERMREFNRIMDEADSSNEYYDVLLGFEQETFNQSVVRYRAEVDSIANAITTGVSIAVGIALAFVTAGAGTMAIAALASAINVGTKRLVLGSSYGRNAVTIDIGLSILDVVMGRLTQNLGGNLINRSENLTRLANDPSFKARLLASAISESYASIPGQVVQNAASQFVNEGNYNSSDPFGDATVNFIKDFTYSMGVGIVQNGLNYSASQLGRRAGFGQQDTQVESNVHESQSEEVALAGNENAQSEEISLDDSINAQSEEVSLDGTTSTEESTIVTRQGDGSDLNEVDQNLNSHESTKSWNDDSLDVTDFLAVIQRDNPNTSLNEQQLRARFDQGYRFNPRSRRWVRNWGNSSVYEYNMVENPGPLAEIRNNPASNFAGGRYNTIELQESTILYRGGEMDTPLGQWFTFEPPSSVANVRIDSAVRPQWIDTQGGLTGTSPINAVHAVRIPAGTTIYVGPVGTQGGVYLGGHSQIQIFVQTPWTNPDVEVVNSAPLN